MKWPPSEYQDRMDFLGKLEEALGCCYAISAEDTKPVEDAVHALYDKWFKDWTPEDFLRAAEGEPR
jgi:hypothetical protein